MDMHTPPDAANVLDTIAPISRQIWDAKYRLKQVDGTPVDLTIEDSWRRVARALAEAEKEPAKWERPFYEALQDFRFLPAGRIASGAGSDRKVTLFNCFVMGDIGDDLSSIFNHLREAALTMQQGGGIGYDFSSLRPKGAPVARSRRRRLRPALSFMDVWDSDVPHHHVRRRPPRRHDGHHALRPSGHRGLHRRQARARPPPQLQPLRPRHRRRSWPPSTPTPTGT